jgi:hypothetical protein
VTAGADPATTHNTGMTDSADPRTTEATTIRASSLVPGDIWRLGATDRSRGIDGADEIPGQPGQPRWAEVVHTVFGPDHGVEAVWVTDRSLPPGTDEDALLDGIEDTIEAVSAKLCPLGFWRYGLDALVEIQAQPYAAAEPRPAQTPAPAPVDSEDWTVIVDTDGRIVAQERGGSRLVQRTITVYAYETSSDAQVAGAIAGAVVRGQ